MLESYLAYYNRSTGLNILFEETLEMLGITASPSIIKYSLTQGK